MESLYICFIFIWPGYFFHVTFRTDCVGLDLDQNKFIIWLTENNSVSINVIVL